MIRILVALLFALGIGITAQARVGGGGSFNLVNCTASPPSQASSISLIVLKLCNGFANNNVVDVNNTLASGYLFYPSTFAQSANTYATLPSGNISNSGPGLTINGDVSNYSGGLFTTQIQSNRTYENNGFTVSGSYYVEMTIKFDSTNCNPGLPGPAFWADGPGVLVNSRAGGALNDIETDFFECFVVSGSPIIQTHVNIWTSGSLVCSNSNIDPAITPDSNFHTYGFLRQTVADGGGTGQLVWYYDNVAVTTVTYTATSTPNPSSGCPGSRIIDGDTQPYTIIIGTKPGNTYVAKDMHLWQAH